MPIEGEPRRLGNCVFHQRVDWRANAWLDLHWGAPRASASGVDGAESPLDRNCAALGSIPTRGTAVRRPFNEPTAEVRFTGHTSGVRPGRYFSGRAGREWRSQVPFSLHCEQ